VEVARDAHLALKQWAPSGLTGAIQIKWKTH
jgi:hypothetical protein